MDYTNLYNFVTSSGIVVPNDASVFTEIQKKYQEIFGTDIDLSAETAVGRLIETYAVLVKSTLGVTAQVANQFNINEATGIYLDALGQIYNVKRIAGTKTKITIKCYFSDTSTGTDTIPAGSLIMGSTNGTLFSIDSAIYNDGSQIEEETGKVFAMGTATAVVSGPITAPPGSVTSIQTAVLGWSGVTNISPTYIGTDIETDEAFRKRIIASRPIGVGFDTHLKSALERLEGVYSNCVLENNTGTPMVKLGIPLPPHSIFIGIECIETEDLLSNIAREISRVKPIGTGMVDSDVPAATLIQRDVSYGYNGRQGQTISFYKAVATAVDVRLTYSNASYVGDDILRDITEVIAEYIDSVGVGGTIYCAMISNVLIKKLNIGIGSIIVQKHVSSTPASTSLQMLGYERPYVDSTNIIASTI